MNLKKKLLMLSVFFLLAVFESKSQDSPAGLILGVTGEIGGSTHALTSNFRLGTGVEEKFLFAYGIGGEIGMRLGNLSFITGGYFTRRGGRTIKRIEERFFFPPPGTTSPDEGVFVDITDRTPMNLFKLPLLLGYQFGGESLKLRISAGLAYNLAIGEQVDFTRTASYPDPAQPGRIIDGVVSSFDDFAPDGFYYGDNTVHRLKKSLVSLLLSSTALIKIKENGFLKLGAAYENYGRIINPLWTPIGTVDDLNPIGKTSMSAITFQVGYEFRLDLGTVEDY